MRSLATLVIATAFGASSTAAMAEGWYHLTDRLGNAYFGEVEEAVQSADHVDVTILIGDLYAGPDGEHVMVNYRFDCSQDTLHSLGTRAFSSEGTELSELTGPAAPFPVSVDSVSPGRLFFEFACLGSHRQSPVDDPFEYIRANHE